MRLEATARVDSGASARAHAMAHSVGAMSLGASTVSMGGAGGAASTTKLLARGGRVSAQVLPERMVLLENGHQHVRAAPHFRPPTMKLSELRVPPWLHHAHRRWHQQQEQRAQKAKK